MSDKTKQLLIRLLFHNTFKAPQISTTSDSSTTVTRKFVVCMSSFSSGPCSLLLQPGWIKYRSKINNHKIQSGYF